MRDARPLPRRRLLRLAALALIAASALCAAANSQAILTRARNLHDRGQTPAAEKLLLSEYEAAKAAGDESHQAWMSFGLGWGKHQLTRHAEALPHLEEAAQLAEKLKIEDLEGLARLELGRTLRQLGRRPMAKRQLEQASLKLRTAQRYDLSAEAVLELTQLETNFRAREAILRTAVAEAGSNARPRHEAQLLLAWGDSQYNQGNSAGAMTTFRRAIDRLENTNMHLLLADAYTGLGRVYRLHGDHDSARTVYRKALTVLGDSAPQARGRVLEMLAVSYASTGQREEAVRAINESVGLARNAAPRVQTKRLTSAAVAYLMLGEPAKTVELLSANSQHCQGRWPLSAALYRLGKYEEAVQHATRGIEECRAAGISEPLARALRSRALSLEALGHREKAIEDAKESLRVVERMRENLAPEDLLKRGFDSSYQQLVQEAVMWLHDSKRHAEAIEVAEQGRARAFVDLLATSRTTDTLQEDDPIRLQGEPARTVRSTASEKAATLPRMQAAAAGIGSTIVSYWLGNSDVYSWVVDARGLRASVRTPLPYTTLEKLVQQAASRELAASRAGLRELYRLLIAPVEAQLPATAGARITVIPHGLLFQLPFAALLDTKGKYLIERWETHYAPSIASLETAGTKENGQGYLLLGNPLHPAAPDGAKPLAPLPGSQQELTRVAALLPVGKAKVLAAKQLRLDPVLEAMASNGVLHFATHAVVDQQRPFESYLALSEGDRLAAREIYSQPLHARLVVLSACRSATGEVSADGVLGLTRAFFSAGVSRVIASIWDAADQTSSVLAESFHREYLQSGDASSALRKAQLSLLARLRSGKFEVNTPAGPAIVSEHPALWAPFVLQGRP
ncbi:MAG: CHAT domain-containing protein [Acidobacteria bacterium]|nr:CHAT domain-containing protein [Acidobacteriota bacterium]